MRFYDPDAGCIRLDGHEIRQVTRKSLRLAYAMVLQDTWLFHGTIFDNIAYGKKDASRPEVEAAAKAARIHSYITRLPEGYDTILNEDGMNISQGQKQLLTIARAMLLDANMLILDEATSNVDTRTEIQIQEAMRALMRGKTCFVIAHRLSTIQNADTILVVPGRRYRGTGQPPVPDGERRHLRRAVLFPVPIIPKGGAASNGRRLSFIPPRCVPRKKARPGRFSRDCTPRDREYATGPAVWPDSGRGYRRAKDEAMRTARR